MSQLFIIQELFSDLTNINVIKSDSAGQSLKYEAVKGEEKVIVKISFDPIIKTSNNQIVESQIYEHVLQYLHKNTPHLPKYYGTKKTTFDKSVNFDISEWCEDRECWNIEKGQIMVIEHVGIESLESLYKTEYDNPQIVFQVLYTIACFERVGLKHNDLHYGNIMIQRLKEPVELSYEINGVVVSFTTNLVVKIIDYDRSCIYHQKVERNFYLDFLLQESPPINHYNGINNGFDAFKFLSTCTYKCGDLKNWLSFVCPKILHSIYDLDLLPQTVNPREFVPNTVEVLESLVDNFPGKFSVNSFGPKEKVYCLPEDTSVKPIVDKTKFLVSRCLKTHVLKKHSFMYKELLSIGYNWKLHHCKLFTEAKETFDIPECDDSALYKACIWITNPNNQGEEPNDYVNVIRGIYRPILFIPQKESCDYEHESIPEEKIEKGCAPKCIPQQKAVEEVLISLPEKYLNSAIWHIFYSEEERDITRKYLVEIRDKFLPELKQSLDLLDNKYYALPGCSDPPKKRIMNCVQQCFSVINNEKLLQRKIKVVYILFAVLSRTLFMFRDEKNFLSVLENKVSNLKKVSNVDFSSLIEFDVPILPKIEEVIPNHLM
jgi:hypothetical protein